MIEDFLHLPPVSDFEKREKISSVWRWGEVTRWRWVGVPPPGVCWFFSEAKRQLNYVGQVIFKIARDPSIHKVMAIKGGSKHPLPLSQPYTIRRSTPLRVRRGKHRGDTRKVQEADPDGLLHIVSWTFSCQSPLYSLYIQHFSAQTGGCENLFNERNHFCNC